jgi:hypothetical protein
MDNTGKDEKKEQSEQTTHNGHKDTNVEPPPSQFHFEQIQNLQLSSPTTYQNHVLASTNYLFVQPLHVGCRNYSLCARETLQGRRMVRTLRKDEFSSTPLSHRPEAVQKVPTEEVQTRRNHVKTESPHEGVERVPL